MKGTIGIIGLGIMGGAFARNLAAGGWKVIGYDIDAARRAEAKAAGVEIAAGAEAVAKAAKDIITSLPTPQAVLATARRSRRPKRRRRTVIETSTLALADKTGIQARPERPATSRSTARCRAPARRPRSRTSSSTPAATAAAITRLEPAFLGFARKVYDLGAYGNGSKMKFVANHLVAIHNVASGGSDGARHEGRPRSAPVVRGDRLRRRHIAHIRAARADDGRQQLSAGHHAVDDLEEGPDGDWRFAAGLGCPTPLFGLASALHMATLAAGHGAEDTAAVCARWSRWRAWCGRLGQAKRRAQLQLPTSALALSHR